MIAAEASQAIRQHQKILAEAIVTRQYALQSTLWKPFGHPGHQKSVRDAGYHLDYLCEALTATDPLLFVDYVAWVKVLFAGLHFPESVLPTTLECTRAVFDEQLPAQLAAVANAYIAAGLRSITQTPTVPPTFMSSDAPLAELAQNYLDALLNSDRQTASRLILDAVTQGVPINAIYLDVFQRVQHEVGRLWQTNRLSVAQEHFCTAATQLVMSQLYPYIFSQEKTGQKLVATCVGSELHEIGVRMVADFFEMEGWDTYYLGANTPIPSVIHTIIEQKAHMLAISATLTPHIHQVAALIDAVRASELGDTLKILVGGYPFNVSTTLWRAVGADGYAPNAQEAINLADDLLTGQSVI